jgi:hypothetical protein
MASRPVTPGVIDKESVQDCRRSTGAVALLSLIGIDDHPRVIVAQCRAMAPDTMRPLSLRAFFWPV